jgi:uncharacterized OsmC-like protein
VETTSDGVLIIRRIHVQFKLTARSSDRETAERVHGFFANKCPLYRTLKDCVAITTELLFSPED